jgi:hypothetical protein
MLQAGATAHQITRTMEDRSSVESQRFRVPGFVILRKPDLHRPARRPPVGTRRPHFRTGPAPLERLRGQWRFQLLARSANFRDLHRLLKEVLPKNPAYDLVVDVDPQQLL